MSTNGKLFGKFLNERELIRVYSRIIRCAVEELLGMNEKKWECVKDPHTHENYCAWHNVRKTSRALTQHFDKYFQPIGLKASQLGVLYAISEIGSATITDVAEKIVMDRTTLTRNIKPLVKDGYAEVAVGNDRRAKYITLTEKGRQTLQNAYPYWKEANEHLVNGLGQERWQDMVSSLSKMVSLTK